MIRQQKNFLSISIGLLICFSLTVTVITGCADSRVRGTTGSDTSGMESSESLSDEALNSFDSQYSKVYPLDLAYKEAVKATYSNVEREEVTYTYQTKWKKCIETYYSLLLGKADQQTTELLERIQTQWETNIQKKMDDEVKLLERIYEGGTLVPVLASEYKYSLYRCRAIELYIMCQQWCIRCDAPSGI